MLLVLLGLGAFSCSEDATPEAEGEALFSRALPNTNGRSCASCHVPEDGFTLTPAHVEALYARDPNDPLFAAIDADDPDAETLTFEHLRLGLVRVWLTLPETMDVIDKSGAVTTPEDRKIFVWRSVPSIADSALTAPYQLDGHVASLEEQAQGAITGHSEGGTASPEDLQRIAAFERTVFTSERARTVARYLARGGDPESAPDVEATLELTPEEARGRVVYDRVCASCHGGANRATILHRDVHAMSFPALRPDGTVLYAVPATEPPTPLYAEPGSDFINIGTAFENFLVFIGGTEHESFSRSVDFPQYRFRFYADASRAEVIAELPPGLPFPPPPPPEHCGLGGGEGEPMLFSFDDDCNPITGPNFSVQMFTTDPGRAAVTGDPRDFEAFDIPTLRGISRTAPYWHNNISGTLEEVIDLYSDHLFAKYPQLTINDAPPEPDPDGDVGPVEALSERQKRDLLAYLQRL